LENPARSEGCARRFADRSLFDLRDAISGFNVCGRGIDFRRRCHFGRRNHGRIHADLGGKRHEGDAVCRVKNTSSGSSTAATAVRHGPCSLFVYFTCLLTLSLSLSRMAWANVSASCCFCAVVAGRSVRVRDRGQDKLVIADVAHCAAWGKLGSRPQNVNGISLTYLSTHKHELCPAATESTFLFSNGTRLAVEDAEAARTTESRAGTFRLALPLVLLGPLSRFSLLLGGQTGRFRRHSG
jgi:hypothetical protein